MTAKDFAVADGSLVGTTALRVGSQTASAGNTVIIPIIVDAFGNETGYTFGLSYDATKLSSPQVVIGDSGGDVVSNTNTAGQIGFSVTSFAGGTIASGNNKVLVNVTFTVAANASGTAAVAFSDTPARRKTSGDDPNTPLAQPTFTDGTVTVLGPTAAGVSVSGRVWTANGRGIQNVTITLTNANGESRIARTTSFGYYQFNDVPVGQTYIINAAARRYQFDQATRALNLNDAVDGINFVALP